MSETRFFKNFPSFACKALAETLWIGDGAHTSTPYVFVTGGLRVDYLCTTRHYYASARPPTRNRRSGIPQVLATVDTELGEDPVEVSLDGSYRDALGVRDLTVGVALPDEVDDPAFRRREPGSAGRG